MASSPKNEKKNKNQVGDFSSKKIDSDSGINTMQDDLVGLMKSKNPSKSKKKKVRKTTTDSSSNEVQRELVDVYTNGDGEIPDLTKLEKVQRPVWKTVLYTLSAALFVLLMAAIAGFFVFFNVSGDKFTNENIILKVDTPITIVSGEEAIYTISITNREQVNLYNAQLKIDYPDNFEYLEANPQASGDKNDTWDFSVLKVGETKTIEIKGKIVAAVDSTQTFKGTLEFKPENLNAFFKQEAIVDVAVSSSIVSLDVDAPKKILSNQDLEYKIKYENLSEEDLIDLQLVVEYPKGFVFDSSDPESDDENHSIWEIKSLPAGASGELTIAGNYSAVDAGGNQELNIRIQIKQGNDYYPQSLESSIVEVIKDQLSVQLIINGSGEDQPISFEDLLVCTVNYANSGQEDLENIEITAYLDSAILDWSSLVDDNDGRVSNNSITWTGRQVAKLLKLGPGESGEINFQIRVRDADYAQSNDVDKFSIESYIKGTAEQSGEGGGVSTVESKKIVNSVNSDLSLAAVARYYDESNLPLGLGPIQPRSGETSTYNIKIDLSNHLNDIKDVRLVAALPKGSVSWADKETHDTGDLIYDSASNKVTWSISRLPKSAGDTAASFNVSIKPSDEDKGRILILVSDISLVATDADTGAQIEKSLKAITTSFDDPIVGRVSGIVE